MRTCIPLLVLLLTLPASAQEERSDSRKRLSEPRGFGRPIELKDDDVAAFPHPPAGYDKARDDVPRGKTEMIEYDSSTVGTRRKMLVYTPPGYSREREYPALYLLHGIGGDETEWERFAQPGVLLDNLIAVGEAVPMIVVMPNGRAQKNDRAEGNVFAAAPAFAVFEQDLLKDVIPTIEARYSVRGDRANRALAGLSMGGGQSLNFGFAHLDKFSWIGGFSSAPNTRKPTELLPDPKAAKDLRLLFLSCGNKDGLIYISQEFHAYLKENQVPHVWHVTSHGHDPPEWKQALYHFLRQLKFDAPAPKNAALDDHPTNQWVLQTPLTGGPTSPRLGYEGACVWDSRSRRLIRYGGHNQGGGGEQGAEVWSLDLATARWTLHEPNTSPPGVCCNAQNVFDPVHGRYVRFPLFSGSHGWQWSRELYLNDSSIWTYDPAENRWLNMRPLPAPQLAPYRCASWDSDERVVVVFGGEGSREGTRIYDPRRNEWRWPRPAVEPAPRSGGNMAYDQARKVHVLFGSQFDNDAHTWTYDVRRNEWRDMQPSTQPPTDKNDAVLTYDSVHHVVLAIVKVTQGNDDSATHELQTWAYDTAKNDWKRLSPAAEPMPSGSRARNLTFAPELNLAILENCPSKPREQQVWTYRYAAESSSASATANEGSDQRAAAPAVELDRQSIASPTPLPLVVEGVASVLEASRVRLTWTPPRVGPVAGYVVERAAVEVWSDDQLRRLKQRTPPLEQPSVGAFRRIGPFRRLNDAPLTETTYEDATVDLARAHPVESTTTGNPRSGRSTTSTVSTVDADADAPVFDRPLHAEHLDESGRPYRLAVFAYRIRVVDGEGRISGPSPPFFTIPSAPQHVFSREQEPGCDLKWVANPEQGIRGYRIYRMDGRFDKEPISRLTTEPISATEYRDESAGTATRRYYVVAVDALGQEGFPSSPVWYRREWREFYRPFTGEWHQ